MTKSTFFILFTLLCVQSCQKEMSVENPSPAPPTIHSDSIYIDRIYEIDITNNVNDTTGIWIYSYDNLKRVVSMILKSTDPLDNSGVKYYYSYPGADTIPFKTMYIEASFASADTVITFHSFDNLKKNIKDSSLHFQNSLGSYYVVRKYQYVNNKIYGLQYSNLIAPGTDYIQQKDTATIDNFENILLSKKYYFNTATSNWELTNTTSFTYDNKLSPFKILSNFKTFRIFPTGETFYYELPSFSNKLSQSETNSIETGNPNTNNFQHSNTYNNSGQLKTVKINGTYSSSTPDSMKLAYIYRKL